MPSSSKCLVLLAVIRSDKECTVQFTPLLYFLPPPGGKSSSCEIGEAGTKDSVGTAGGVL